jgi:hypothetical protein
VAAEEQPAVEVRLSLDGVDWERTLLAALAGGGLALGVERQLFHAAENSERSRKGEEESEPSPFLPDLWD